MKQLNRVILFFVFALSAFVQAEEPIALSSDQPLQNLSGNAGDSPQVYFIDVSPSTTFIKINIAGGSGDADLYVRKGSIPTDSNFDCRPYRNGNEESCEITESLEGRWYIYLKAYSTFNNVTLTASYDGFCDAPPMAEANGPYSGQVGSQIQFSSEGSWSCSPGDFHWDFGDGTSSNEANPTHAYDNEGTYTVTLTNQGYGVDHATVTITNALANACSTQAPKSFSYLSSGTPVCVVSRTNRKSYFYFYNQNKTSATIRTAHGNGDVGLYYSDSGWPSTTQFTKVSNNSGNSEQISITELQSGWHYIMLNGTHSGLTVQVDLN